MRLLAAQINPTIGDFEGNTRKILSALQNARSKGCDFVLFPEMCLCGYPPDDFLLLHGFIEKVEEKLGEIISACQGLTVVLGLPRRAPGMKGLKNSAAIIHDARLLGFQDKALLPTYDVFDECRYFDESPKMPLWEAGGKKFGVTICEDIWQHSELVKFTNYHFDPILDLKGKPLDFLLNLSASPYSRHKFEQRLKACRKAAITLNCPVVLCNQVGGNDSLIFDGCSLYVGKEGLLACGKGFAEDELLIDFQKRQPPIAETRNEISDLYQALCLGLKDYFQKSGFSQALIGLSGGIDSALVACIACEALGPGNVLGVGMPSRFSSKGSIEDAEALAKNLGLSLWQVPIEGPFQSMLDLLEPHFAARPFDVTEENLQARIRGMILMALSNKFGRIVLSTGNKSELAMGYATLYGDMCGGLGVISDLTKREVYALADWVNRERALIPESTIKKAPSAELKANQKDSDTLPDYDIIDNVLSDYVERHLSPEEIASKHHYSLELVQDLLRRIHQNEYKRRQSAPTLRVSEKAFSVGYRFPIVQKWRK